MLKRSIVMILIIVLGFCLISCKNNKDELNKSFESKEEAINVIIGSALLSDDNYAFNFNNNQKILVGTEDWKTAENISLVDIGLSDGYFISAPSVNEDELEFGLIYEAGEIDFEEVNLIPELTEFKKMGAQVVLDHMYYAVTQDKKLVAFKVISIDVENDFVGINWMYQPDGIDTFQHDYVTPSNEVQVINDLISIEVNRIADEQTKVKVELTQKMLEFIENEKITEESFFLEYYIAFEYCSLIAMVKGTDVALDYALKKENESEWDAYLISYNNKYEDDIFEQLKLVKKGDMMDDYGWFLDLVNGIDHSYALNLNAEYKNYLFNKAYPYFEGTTLQADLDQIKIETEARINAEQLAKERELAVEFLITENNRTIEMYKNNSGDLVQTVAFDFTSETLREGQTSNKESNYYIQVRINDGSWESAFFDNGPLVYSAIFWNAGKYKVDIRAVKDNLHYGEIKTINVTIVEPEIKKGVATINNDNTINFPDGGLGEGGNWIAYDKNGDYIEGIHDDGITLEEAKLIYKIELSDWGRANTPIFTIQGIQFFPNLQLIIAGGNSSGATEDLEFAKELGIEIEE